MNRLFVLIIVSYWLVSCSSSYVNQRYTYIDKQNEWEIELIFRSDSLFVLKDKYGCVQMGQKGTWKKLKNGKSIPTETLLLTDTTQVEVGFNMHQKKRIHYVSNLNNKQYMFTEDQYFPLISSDTVHFLDARKIVFRKMIFKKFNGNLQKRRIKMIEKFYIKKLGRRNYIMSLGEGVSIKKARENLKKCSN